MLPFSSITRAIIAASARRLAFFLTDQGPQGGRYHNWDRLYDLEITPQRVAISDALVILHPWVHADAASG